MKRISTTAYQSLRNALPLVTWYKRPFETLLRTSLREHPELLIGLNFGETKRIVADTLVNELSQREDKYQEVTLQLMLEIASMTRFPDIESIKDIKDRQFRIDEARRAVSDLKSVTEIYSKDLEETQKQEAARIAGLAQSAALRRFNDDIEELRSRFLEQQKETEPHARGYAFESILADLFLLYDLTPRLAYKIELEQIDGSISFETDDYILEARWRTEQADRSDGDIFAAKVQSKGKNAMGLIISVSGFSSAFLERFKAATPFITMDGADMYAVLENRLRLDDLLRAKKRHANETGSCFLAARDLITS